MPSLNSMFERSHSDSLFAGPSWLSGIARLFDFWGHYDRYNSSQSPRWADSQALASDWRAIGQDLNRAIAQYSQERHHS